MTEFDLNQLKQISPSDLESAGLITKSPRGSRKDGHGYCCVYCSSGTGQNQSGGLDFDYRGDAWVHTCRSCGNGGDNIKFFQHVFNSDFTDACRQASEMFGIPIADSNNFGDKTYHRPTAPLPKPAATQPPRLKLPEKTLPEQVPLIKDDIAQAQKTLEILPEDQRRGLLLDTLKYFNCGFAPRWVHPVCRLEDKKVTPTPRIIIPTSDGEHYLALALDRDRKLDPKNSFHKPHAGAKTQVFNAADLRHETLIVVEGEVDAMSIFQACTLVDNAQGVRIDPCEKNFGVVATLSAGGWQNLIVAQMDNGLFDWHKFIILFDNDDAGHKTAEEFKAALAKRNCPAVIKFLDDYISVENKDKLGDKIDANKILTTVQNGNYHLRFAIRQLVNDAEKEFGDIHNQRTLDFNAAPVETATVAEQPVDTSKNIFDEWQELNGKINPDVVPKILDAHNYLGSITVGNLTPDIVQSSKLKHSLALCTFYDTCSADVSKFFATLGKVRKAAKENLQLVANDLATEDENSHAWEIFSVTTFKADIDKIKKQIAKAHKNFTRSENSRIASENNQRRIQAAAEQNLTLEDRLSELREKPKTPERDAEIISLVQDICEWKLTKDGDRDIVKCTASNVNRIFTYDPNVDRVFAFDEFQQTIVFTQEPIWAKPETPRVGTEWKDADDSQLRMYLRSTYREFANEKLVYDAIVSYGKARAFNEPLDWINSLRGTWDGKKRADSLFIKFLGAEDTVFNRKVTAFWLMGTLCRLFHPGCDFQSAVVLLGAQRIGKSRLLEMLGGKRGVNPSGKGYHVSLVERLDDTHAIDAIQRAWIVELEEFTAGTKADVTAIKSFISAAEDTHRFAYGRRAESIKRHCAIAITTNNDSFLKDPTGNARFLVVKCTKEKYKQVEGMTPEYIRQVWAEVIFWYDNMFADGFDESKLQLSNDIRLESERRNAAHLLDDGMQSEFDAWLGQKILPQYIWLLLTKEERARFCINGKLTLINGSAELIHRRRQVRPKNREADIRSIRQFCIPYVEETGEGSLYAAETEVKYMGERAFELTLYGSEYRQHICTAEIMCEAFPGNDKRKSNQRINELFNSLEGHGWHKNSKAFYGDKRYDNQRNTLWRDAGNVPRDDDDEPTTQPQATPPPIQAQAVPPTVQMQAVDDFGGVPVAPEDLPFDPDDMTF